MKFYVQRTSTKGFSFSETKKPCEEAKPCKHPTFPKEKAWYVTIGSLKALLAFIEKYQDETWKEVLIHNDTNPPTIEIVDDYLD